MKIIEKFKYTKDHEWCKILNDDLLIGITDYAQNELGDINLDGLINILDVVYIVSLILGNECFGLLDINSDNFCNVLDIIELVNIVIYK